jgi:hypothetical protein
MNNKWFRKITPCIIMIGVITIFIIQALIEYKKTSGWSMVIPIIGVPFIIILLLMDWIIKKFTTYSNLKIWLVEIGLICLIIFLFFVWRK